MVCVKLETREDCHLQEYENVVIHFVIFSNHFSTCEKKLNMKMFVIVLLLIVLVSVFMACKDSVSENSEISEPKPFDIENYRILAAEAKAYCNDQDLNKDYFLKYIPAQLCNIKTKVFLHIYTTMHFH